jgi:hypothetical protein
MKLRGPHIFWKLIRTAHWWIVFALLTVPASAQEETSTQLWFSTVLGRQKSESLYMEVEIQPKTQISGGEHWRNIDATWNVEYYPNKWFDLTCELVTGYTENINDLNSFEVTPRPGLRLHLAVQTVSEIDRRQKLLTERMPLQRFHFATWLRLEQRNFFYSGDRESSHEWRFRVRPEFKVALNNPSLGDDGTLYGRGDVEFFWPLTKDVPERFVNKFRFRIGPGYRIDYGHRVELMFMYDRNRESSLVGFKEDAFMLDLRLTFLF